MKKYMTMALCAVFAALSAILSQLSIPIGSVPVSFTHISVFMAAGLLGAKYGAVSQLVYVLIGAAGAPVFSNLHGGLGWILGHTGGFIVGYIVCAFVAGLIIERFGKSFAVLMAAMYAGWVVTYAIGIPWFMVVTGSGFTASLTLCFYPFLPGDLLKTIFAAVLLQRLYPVLKKSGY